MNIFTNVRATLTGCMLGLLTAGTCFAQAPGGMPGMDANLSKFFGDHKSFSSKAEMEMKGTPQGDTTMTMNFLLLEGKMRMEIDMGQMKSAQIPAEAIAQIKKMGMDKMTVVTRPDKKITWMIYPGLQSYAETAMTSAQIAGIESTNKIEKTSLGKETIDGHPCEKNKVVTTDADGKKHEAIVWNATDLQDFPVQMQVSSPQAEVLMKYKDIKLEKPDSKLFEAPSDFKKYATMQEMMQTEMMKRMGGGMGGPQ
jgi:hypothetical protein